MPSGGPAPTRREIPTSREIRSRFADDPYAAYHAPRYALVLRLAHDLARSSAEAGVTDDAGMSPVLDIGPTHLTTLLAGVLGCPIDTLGLGGPVVDAGGTHTEYDLTLTRDPGSWPRIGPYRLVIFAEVIEHLPIAPRHVLAFLRSILRPGGVLVIQTPNAAALHQRLKLLTGRHPYHMIHPVGGASSAHFREYTLAELRRELAGGGFSVERVCSRAYFDYARDPRAAGRPWRRRTAALARAVLALAPARLRPGFTLVCRGAA